MSAGSSSGSYARMSLTSPLDLVRLPPLMERSLGIPQVRIGLIDGPILTSHPDLIAERIQPIGPKASLAATACSQRDSFACVHGTFVAGILAGRRNSHASGICPG